MVGRLTMMLGCVVLGFLVVPSVEAKPGGGKGKGKQMPPGLAKKQEKTGKQVAHKEKGKCHCEACTGEGTSISSSDLTGGGSEAGDGSSESQKPGKSGQRGNNGLGNGIDPQPPGNPPINDGDGAGPGAPGNKKGGHAGKGAKGGKKGESDDEKPQKPQKAEKPKGGKGKGKSKGGR